MAQVADPHTDHPADDAAYYAGIARNKLYAVQGEETGDPAHAHQSLISARSWLRAALAEIDGEMSRYAFDYGLDDPEDVPSPAPAPSLRRVA
jgi:hypothetical protein